MLLIRALNEYDIISNPLKNGLASKEMIYNLTKSYLENSKNKDYLCLNVKEKDIFIKEHIKDYIVAHKGNLEKYYKKRNKLYKSTMNALLNNHNPAGYIMFRKYISSLQGHLSNGSRTYTNWISTSKNINSIYKYYDEQDVHRAAIILSNTNGIIDGDRVLTIDVSSDDKINNNIFLCNKISCDDIETLAFLSTEYPYIINDYNYDYVIRTNKKAMGFNFSKSSSEVCIYEYLPSSHIIGLIEALQMDLIKIKAFNFNYYKLDKREQVIYLNDLKKRLFKCIKKENDPFLLHVYQELYIDNKNINSLINLGDNKDRIINGQKKILRLARTLPNIQIKR